MTKLLLSASFVALSALAGQAATISTLDLEHSEIIYWGLPDTSAYGQTFTLGEAAKVKDVTFRINDYGNAIAYDLLIYAWNGASAVGAALTSVAGATAGLDGMATVTTSANNVALEAGQYVAFLQALSYGSAAWGSIGYNENPYADGVFVFQNNRGDVGQVTNPTWYTLGWQGPGADLAFAINTTTTSPAAVPLPAGLPLLLAGIGGLAALRRRKPV